MKHSPRIFKNTNQNSFRTRDLFVDVIRASKSSHKPIYMDTDESLCLYWLIEREDPSDPRPVLREKFLEYRDYTGYKMANTLLGGWRHMERLLKCPWFAKAFESWKEELFILIQSEALEKIKDIADAEGATALSAAKYLANKEWEKPEAPARGRPSKAEVSGKLSEDARKAKTIQNDYERIMNSGLTVISGGKS